MFLIMFLGVAKLGNMCFGRKICVREAKMFLTSSQNIFCLRAAKFVSATRFLLNWETGKHLHPQQCFWKNVS